MPRKLGQHFLIRDSILEKLAVAACGSHAPRVVEIGPGRGALTRHLLPLTDELHAVELDERLVRRLQESFRGDSKLHVHHAEVLATDLSQWGPAIVVGNLPYYITSPILEKFCRLDANFPSAVFLMQWEVAERLLAEPGSRSYGYLTVATRLRCTAELICKVPPSAFAPPPKVDSAGVLLRRQSRLPDHLPELLRLASAAFMQKRKTLRNNLRAHYGTRVDSLPEAGLRAEQLSVSQFVDLFSRLADPPAQR